MKFIKSFTVLFALMLFGCAPKGHLEWLDGAWILDGDLTIKEHTGSELPELVLKAINSSSDEMAFVFKGNKTTYTPIDSVEEQETWFKWKLIEDSENSLLIELPKGKRLRFFKFEQCIGLLVDAYSYTEYYCKAR
ncbi:hypothetical protein [Zooshikella sp. RANM57]|uniref:hypothetical protein n=1 Tax=Zooshikella sp. RANM57 TaxID=3425863 RepID=UPI003D6DCC40